MQSSDNGAAEFPYAIAVRVYWEDTDAGGVVFYANYLKFFERARTEWLRTHGIEQQALRVETGAMFVVAEVQMKYFASARLDDLLSVTVQVVSRRGASMEFAQQAWRGSQLLTEGRIRVGCINDQTMKPCRLPPEVVHALKPS
jgi:acyl-CoA thioester hydrolase